MGTRIKESCVWALVRSLGLNRGKRYVELSNLAKVWS